MYGAIDDNIHVPVAFSQRFLRWQNTVFVCTFADVIHCMHNDCKKKHVQYRSKVSYHPSSPFLRDETLVARDETLVSRDETLVSREPLERIFWNTLQAVSLIQRSFDSAIILFAKCLHYLCCFPS